jgi:ComF family protein
MINFFSPWIVRQCCHCDRYLTTSENALCWKCEHNLYFTNHFQNQDNKLKQELTIRMSLFSVQSLTYFRLNSPEQSALHHLKYKNSQQIGTWMGEKMAQAILTAPHLSDLDALLPIPMAPIKEYKRGYNQAEEIAKGIQKSLNIPIKFPVRKKLFGIGATKNNRKKRVSMNYNPFTSSKLFQAKHALIVDDVLTTGSTIEKYIRALSPNNFTKLSVITFSHTL